MTLPLIPTTVIGSLPKPAWLTGTWYSVVERWDLEGDALEEAMDDATRLALADQEAAGIDIVCDGEQRRSTHYTHFIHQLGGVDCRNLKPAGRPIPALIVTGDTAPDRLREAQASGYPLLHKPVMPGQLHTAIRQLMVRAETGREA